MYNKSNEALNLFEFLNHNTVNMLNKF